MEKSAVRQLQIPVFGGSLGAELTVPQAARAAVLFVHGSGSSRFSPRNRYVAELLNLAGLATLLIDLLTAEEARVDEVSAEFRFNIDLLCERTVAALKWLHDEKETAKLDIGCFGASTGSAAALRAAALRAAAEQPQLVSAVVSRGGRPDLAGDALPAVEAATLLIVGGADHIVLELNRGALRKMHCDRRLEIVPNASHLFEEPGALDHVVRLSIDWFHDHLDLSGKRRRAG